MVFPLSLQSRIMNPLLARVQLVVIKCHAQYDRKLVFPEVLSLKSPWLLSQTLDALFFYVPLFRASIYWQQVFVHSDKCQLLNFHFGEGGDRHHPACVELKALPTVLAGGQAVCTRQSLMVGAGPVSSPLVRQGDSASADSCSRCLASI